LSLTAAGWPTASDWDRPFGPRAGMAAIGHHGKMLFMESAVM